MLIYEKFNINKKLKNNIKMYRTSSKTHYNKHMIKEFTPPRLHLLGPASNGLGLSIMLKSVKICVYNAQMLLKPTPISPKYLKNGYLASFCHQFGGKLNKFLLLLVFSLFIPQITPNPTCSYKLAPKIRSLGENFVTRRAIICWPSLIENHNQRGLMGLSFVYVVGNITRVMWWN